MLSLEKRFIKITVAARKCVEKHHFKGNIELLEVKTYLLAFWIARKYYNPSWRGAKSCIPTGKSCTDNVYQVENWS